MEYNGWTNYETWTVFNWWSSDGTTEWFRERAESLSARIDPSDRDECAEVIDQLEDKMQAFLNESMPDWSGVWGDLVSGSVSVVNWRELAIAVCEGVVEVQE